MLALNHYPRHVGDFIRDTVGLSLAERGAYTALLDQYYASERPIPYAERYRLTGAITKADRAAVDYVMHRYFDDGQDGWHQKRADAEIAAFRERSAKATASAMLSVESRKRSTNVQRTLSERSTELTTNVELASSHKPVAIKAVQELGTFSPPAQTAAATKPANGNHVKNLGTRLPDGWFLPDDWKAWAVAYRPDWDEERVIRESLVFRDYWYSKPGKDGRKAHWLATWRNWVRRTT